MDYKLEALHKSYQRRFVAWIVSFIAGFTIAAALIITAAFLKSDVIAIIGGSLLLILIVAYAIACFTNCTTPEWLEKAEQEYQRELLKIKLEKQLKEEQAKKEFENAIQVALDAMAVKEKEREMKLDYLCNHYKTLDMLISEKEKEAKKSALDKKLEAPHKRKTK